MLPMTSADPLRPELAIAASAASTYLGQLPDRFVTPPASALAAIDLLDTPLPEQPSGPAEVVELLDDGGRPGDGGVGRRALLRLRHRRLAAGRARRGLAGRRLGPERGLEVMSPAAAAASSEIAAGWLLDVLGLPAGSGVGFVTGATAGNFTGARRRPPRAARPPGLGRRARRACSARRRSRSWSARRCTSACSRRWRSSASDATAWSACRSTARAACAPTGCRRSTTARIVCVQAGNVNTGRLRPAGASLRRRPRRRRVGPRRRRLRPVAGRRAGAGAPRRRRRRGRLVGDRRAQVAQRALRQRLRHRAATPAAGGAMAAAGAAYLPSERAPASRTTTCRRCRGGRAASRSGRRCAPSAAPGVADLVERTLPPRATASPRACAPPATRC